MGLTLKRPVSAETFIVVYIEACYLSHFKLVYVIKASDQFASVLQLNIAIETSPLPCNHRENC